MSCSLISSSLRREHVSIVSSANIRGVPDLVVEILSPSSRRTDCITKKALYARFGVPSYWILDPDLDRLELYRLEGEGYALVQAATKPEVVRPAEVDAIEISLAHIFA